MISISTKGRYATRIMIRLACLKGKGPIHKGIIAKAEGITPDYVEQILVKLKAAGFAQSHRGSKGGYSIAVDPASVTVQNVIAATEGEPALAPCMVKDCARTDTCAAKDVWQEANQAMIAVFSSKTIEQLANETERLQNREALTFQI